MDYLSPSLRFRFDLLVILSLESPQDTDDCYRAVLRLSANILLHIKYFLFDVVE